MRGLHAAYTRGEDFPRQRSRGNWSCSSSPAHLTRHLSWPAVTNRNQLLKGGIERPTNGMDVIARLSAADYCGGVRLALCYHVTDTQDRAKGPLGYDKYAHDVALWLSAFESPNLHYILPYKKTGGRVIITRYTDLSNDVIYSSLLIISIDPPNRLLADR